jgi:hypothetical protein
MPQRKFPYLIKINGKTHTIKNNRQEKRFKKKYSIPNTVVTPINVKKER